MSIIDATTIPPPINWAEMECVAQEGGDLCHYILNSIHQSRWGESNRSWNLLHYACRYDDVRALVMLLKSNMIDVNQKPSQNNIAMYIAIRCRNNDTIILLLLASGSMICYQSLTEMLCKHSTEMNPRMKLLIANGLRTRKLPYGLISDEMRYFEQGVLRCRDVIVVLLGLKKRRQVLGKLDRFLVKQELAVAIWSTRHDAEDH